MLKKYYSCPEVIGRALIIFINVCNFDKAKEIMMSEEDKRKLFTNYYSRLLELCRKDKNDDSYKIK